MDRPIVYIGEIPLDTDFLGAVKDSYISIAKACAAVLGTGTLLNAFTCIPTGPASMQVVVTPGEIYTLANCDTTAYGSLGTDTHPILKQGISLDNTTLTLTAPSIVGDSWNYLIQIGFSETDGGSTVLPYYNASNPSQAWAGPNNTGISQNTKRIDGANIQAKQGVAAPTGTQVTPSPDSGFTGAFVVTIAYGQTTINSGNISVYNSANFINETLTQKISQATADLRYPQIASVQSNLYCYGIDTGAANVMVASLSPALGSYSAGQVFYIKVNHNNTGATTVNLNSLGAKNVLLTNGANPAAGDLIAGMIAILAYDGTQFQLENPATAAFTASAIQNSSFVYANDTGAANAYVAALTPALTAYTAGLALIVKIANTNTTSSTINVNSLGVKNIKLNSGSNPFAGDIVAGMEAWLIYDGTNFQLMNPQTLGNEASNIQNQAYVYAASTTAANTYTASLSPAPASYVAGLTCSIKFTNANTGTATINLNSLGAKTMKRLDGTNLSSGDIAAGMVATLIYDGTNFQLTGFSPANLVTSSQVQANQFCYAASTTAANTYTATLSPVPAAYTTGMKVDILFTNTNTGAATINLNSLGAISIKRNSGSALSSGDIQSNQVATLVYDGTNFQLQNANPSNFSSLATYNDVLITSSGTYTPTAGTRYFSVELVGGGASGGGGAGAVGGSAGGGGGGAGGYSRKLYTASQLGATATVTIGAAGAAGTAGNNPGNAGGNSTFAPAGAGGNLTANGGSAGSGMANSASVGGAGGGGGGSATGGLINISGQSGGSSLTGGSALWALAGMGGSTPPYGLGGNISSISGTNAVAGTGGIGYGSGGAGAAVSGNGGDRAGGAGVVGACIIREFI